jgi:hypothetical protein
VALAHVEGESFDAVGAMSMGAEVLPGDFAAGAVLDVLDASLVVLVDHRDAVARVDAVVDAGAGDRG